MEDVNVIIDHKQRSPPLKSACKIEL